jgi:uncharacterized protein (DUF58 family)
MTPALSSRLSAWFSRTPGLESGPVTLTQRRIFILPTRAGLLFAATVLLMLLGCVNYNLGLGYLLTFLMSGVGIASILHTFRNLSQLQLRAGRAQPVFVGDDAMFPLLLANSASVSRLSIGLMGAGSEPIYVDVGAALTAGAHIRLPAQRRGRLPLGRLRVFTTYPLGLFHAWSHLELDLHCLVYPRPEAGRIPLPAPRAGDTQGLETGQGQDDFAGLRKYQPGDSLRHVAWKAVARGQPVMTKQFSGLAAGELWLEWDELPADLRTEARLSRMTRWVLDAASAGHAYGLRLPSIVIPPATGPAHREQCLTALALFKR